MKRDAPSSFSRSQKGRQCILVADLRALGLELEIVVLDLHLQTASTRQCILVADLRVLGLELDIVVSRSSRRFRSRSRCLRAICSRSSRRFRSISICLGRSYGRVAATWRFW